MRDITKGKTHVCPECGNISIGELEIRLQDKDGNITLHCMQCLIKLIRTTIPELKLLNNS